MCLLSQNYNDECLGAIGKQDPNYADYYPVDAQIDSAHPSITLLDQLLITL